MKPISEVYNMDCMNYMNTIENKFFDLAIVDPPYGIGENWKKDKGSKFYFHSTSYKNKIIPNELYFSELFRISKNRIIWGGNYFTEYLHPTNSWIIWDKCRDVEVQLNSEIEMAWTSFSIPARKIKLLWNGCATCEKRSGIHPHEKPIKLYSWIIRKYANKGNKIFDSHLGSGSIRIAAYKLGFDFWGTEIDEIFFNDAEIRFRNECFNETRMSDGKVYTQKSLFEL
jgi:site-specific DNA-methyltransferase (adenine-specific)